MILLQVLAIVLVQFAVGTLLMTSLLSTREIRTSFFAFNSILGAIVTGVAMVLLRLGSVATWWEMRYLGLIVLGASAACACFRVEQLKPGRVLLAVTGLGGLIAGLLPMVGQTLAARRLESQAPYLFTATIVAGALLLGVTNVGMILGHWYLLMRKLSFEYLERFGKLLMLAVGVRGLLMVAMFPLLRSLDARLAGHFIENLLSADGQVFFFGLRVLLGVLGPLVLGFMVLRCVAVKANQAATGLLYVAEISVLFGELFAALLLI